MCQFFPEISGGGAVQTPKTPHIATALGLLLTAIQERQEMKTAWHLSDDVAADDNSSVGWNSVLMETSELVQCGDNFITGEQCISCGCCWNVRRLPACYHSYGQR